MPLIKEETYRKTKRPKNSIPPGQRGLDAHRHIDEYAIVLFPEKEGGYSVAVVECRGCMAQGETLEETMVNIKGALVAWLEACEKQGLPIPSPMEKAMRRIWNMQEKCV